MTAAVARRPAMTWPWQDRRGRLVPVKAVALGLVILPGLDILRAIWMRDLGPEPYNAVIHALGLWCIRLLVVTLAVSPLARLLAWPQLLLVRRMLGVATAVYAGLHLGAYAVDQSLDWLKIAGELVKRFYLLLGLISLVGLLALALTSTDAAIRRMGEGWTWLHRLVYPVATLGMAHYFLQVKADTAAPSWLAGVLGLLLLLRLLPARPWAAPAAALVATAGTALGEAGYFHLKLGAPLGLVLQANLSADTGIRPAAIVLAIGLVLSAAVLLRRWSGARRRRPA